MKGTSIDTERETCMSCGRTLTNPLGGLFDDLFGGVGSRDQKIPEEVLVALREAESALALIMAWDGIKRSVLESAQTKAAAALRRFG
jgi:hypothetical protein